MLSAMGTLGQRMRDVWKASGLSQKQLVAGMDVHRNAMGTWMRGERNPTIDSLQKFAEVTGSRLIIDLDHPAMPRRIVSTSGEVADLLGAVDGLDADGLDLVTRLVAAWPGLNADRRTILAGAVATLTRDADEASTEVRSPGAARAVR